MGSLGGARESQTLALEALALEDRALEDRALEDRALEDRALEDRALEDRALEDRALEDRERTVRRWQSPHHDGERGGMKNYARVMVEEAGLTHRDMPPRGMLS